MSGDRPGFNCGRNFACTRLVYYPFCCTFRRHGHFCRKIYGSSRSSTCVPNVWSSGYAGMTLSEAQKLSTGPTFPVFKISLPRDEIHCLVMRWDSMTTCQPTAQYHRLQQQELAPALVLVGGDSQDARTIHGSSRSATVHPSAYVPNGPRLVVVATLGWRNRPLLSTWSVDADDDTRQTWVSPYPNVNHLVLLQKQVTETPVVTNRRWNYCKSFAKLKSDHHHQYTNTQLFTGWVLSTNSVKTWQLKTRRYAHSLEMQISADSLTLTLTITLNPIS